MSRQVREVCDIHRACISLCEDCSKVSPERVRPSGEPGLEAKPILNCICGEVFHPQLAVEILPETAKGEQK